MSTNYYAKHPGQSTSEEGLHIGKCSSGWEFLWRAHLDLGLTSAAEWRKFLDRPLMDRPWVVVDECNVEHSLTEFWETVTVRDASARNPVRRREELHVKGDYWAERQWRDKDGYPFADYEFC